MWLRAKPDEAQPGPATLALRMSDSTRLQLCDLRWTRRRRCIAYSRKTRAQELAADCALDWHAQTMHQRLRERSFECLTSIPSRSESRIGSQSGVLALSIHGHSALATIVRTPMSMKAAQALLVVALLALCTSNALDTGEACFGTSCMLHARVTLIGAAKHDA